MDNPENSLPRWKRTLSRLKQIARPSGDVNEKRIRRKKKLVDIIIRRLTVIKVTLFLVGYLWMLVIPAPHIGRITYIDENALQPGQVTTDWNWGDVHVADLYLTRLEQVRDGNFTSEQRAQWLCEEFGKLGISSSTQAYSFSTSTSQLNGTNAYAVLAAPRHSGTEAIVISASWISRTGEEDGTINMRGVSTVLALANFLKRYSYWGKDIVLVVSNGYLDGMQAWLAAYHGAAQPGLVAEPLKLTSGVIWTALNIDYPGHSFSHLGVFFEGLNGRLPNQDLINSVDRIARYYAHVPVVLYDHLDPREEPSVNKAPSWIAEAIYNVPDIKSYIYQARNVIRHLGYQANGRGSGVHGLFHQFKIDAITLFAVPAVGPHGFHAIGRTVESTLRTMNNLLERLHASFFFYIMTGPQQFLKIGLYLPSAILISVAMMFHGLSTWVEAAWVQESAEVVDSKQPGSPTLQWRPRRRPVITVLCIMIATHFLGVMLFGVISTPFFMNNYRVLSPIVFAIFTFIPLLALVLGTPITAKDAASVSTVLKALNLCFASTVISIITVLNFSLAASLTVVMGIPLVISSSSPPIPLRVLKHIGYSLLGLGWLVFAQKQMLAAMWNWEVLSVWFAPFICIVYVPLLLQAGISCLIPS
ncbi:Gaa1-like protein [Flammula alnicola]|nr:Gaa1-like protein [Flammula alnicola]